MISAVVLLAARYFKEERATLENSTVVAPGQRDTVGLVAVVAAAIVTAMPFHFWSFFACNFLPVHPN